MKLPDLKQVKNLAGGLTEKLLVLVVIAYIAISVGRSVMKNYAVNQQIQALKVEIADLEQERVYLENLIAYYKTDTFKELKAREELGWQKPGEHVLSVPVEPEDVSLTAKSHFVAQTTEEPERVLPNYQKWYQYFFGA